MSIIKITGSVIGAVAIAFACFGSAAIPSAQETARPGTAWPSGETADESVAACDGAPSEEQDAPADAADAEGMVPEASAATAETAGKIPEEATASQCAAAAATPARTASATGSTASRAERRSVEPEPAHACSWTPVIQQQWVVDCDAWDEVRYADAEHTVCSVCSLDLTATGTDAIAHGKAHVLAGEGGGTHSEVVRVPAGLIHHEATGHCEQIVAGYICEGCGARR